MKLDRVKFKDSVKVGTRNDAESWSSSDGLDITVDLAQGLVTLRDLKDPKAPELLVPWSQVRQAIQAPSPTPQPRGPGRPRKEDGNG